MRLLRDSRGFTGLEAAIVLIAFVVVASVFAYVMIGSGFYTAQKSKEVTHTGVETVTSSLQLCGDVIGIGGLEPASLALLFAPGEAPVASFRGMSIMGRMPLTVGFIDESTGTPTGWQWNFGDGSPNSTAQEPLHTYTSAGTYTVILTVSNAAGSNSMRRAGYVTVTVDGPPPVSPVEMLSFDSSQEYSAGAAFRNTVVDLLKDWLMPAAGARSPNIILREVKATVQLTAGNTPIDINKTIVRVTTSRFSSADATVFNGSDWQQCVLWVEGEDGGDFDNLLENGEKVELTIYMPTDSADLYIGKDTEVQIEIMPPDGASLQVHVTTPSCMQYVMSLA